MTKRKRATHLGERVHQATELGFAVGSDRRVHDARLHDVERRADDRAEESCAETRATVKFTRRVKRVAGSLREEVVGWWVQRFV